MSVLFVDDEPQVLRGLERMMDVAELEWECDFASSGQEALGLLEDGDFEVVVTDMRMPGMDGAELLQKVSERYPDMIRIVLSGEANQSAVLKAVGPMHQYLAKPCDPALLKATLQQAFAMRNTLNSDALRKAVSRLPRLPSIPETYEKLTALIQDENCKLDDIGAILERDLAMTAKILQLVNSANFGLTNSVASPRQAVSMLGLSVIQSLVLSTGIFENYNDAQLPESFSQRRQSEHALLVANLSQKIAFTEKLSSETACLAFTGGILHDVGKLVLAAADPTKYECVLSEKTSNRQELLECEQHYFGADHAAVGAYLLSVWGLPRSAVEIVALHHSLPQQRPTKLQALECVVAANLICSNADDETLLSVLPIHHKKRTLDRWRSIRSSMG